MKTFLCLLILFIGVWACDDVIPYDLARPEAGKQKVLVEEISGVRCPNCPDGSRLLEALNEDFDSNLIVVTYHAGSFSLPYKESIYDFKTDQTVALMELLGRPEGYPSAAIQRIPLADKKGFQRLPNSWTATISEAIKREPVVDLSLLVDTMNGFSNLSVTALFLEDVNLPVYLIVYLTEDGLIDPQADTQSRDEYVPDYEHNHVLRRILTPVNGKLWSGNLKALDSRKDSVMVNLTAIPEIVNPDRAAFVVFLYTGEGGLQVEKTKLIP